MPDPIQIVINGDTKAADHEVLTFDEILNLAGIDKADAVPVLVHFRAAVDPEQGELVKGESLKVREGTIITARYTAEVFRAAAT